MNGAPGIALASDQFRILVPKPITAVARGKATQYALSLSFRQINKARVREQFSLCVRQNGDNWSSQEVQFSAGMVRGDYDGR